VHRPQPTTRSGGPVGSAAAPALAPVLAIRLLGQIEVAIGGHQLRLPARAAQALIAILALRPRIRTREAVATEIWPDGDGPGSSASLRQALWLVRSSFAAAGAAVDDYLVIDADVIGLRAWAPVELDVGRFERAISSRGPALEEAIAVYGGDLAECLALECFAVERERLSDAYEDALAEVAEQRLRAGDMAGARESADRLLARDQLREEAHAVLLRVYGRTGSRAQVIRQYRRLATLLDDELGVEPLPETDAAYHQALAETVARSRSRVAGLARLVSVAVHG